MINLAMEFLWSSTPTPIEEIIQNPEIKFTIPFGVVIPVQAPVLVNSVNGMVGNVWLGAYEVNADPLGSSSNVQTNLDVAVQFLNSRIDTQIASVTQLLDNNNVTLSNGIETNRLEILKRASIALVEQIQNSLVDYAKMNYVDEQIATLVGQDQQVLATIQQLSDALAESEDLIAALEYTVANRVRFDVANQALTSLQKYNARTNIGAEEIGTAKLLIDAITADSIGAATKAQGALAQSAIQSGDLAPVALTGKFSDLSGQDKIYDAVISTFNANLNQPVGVSDSLLTALQKIQSQINNINPTWLDAFNFGTVSSLINPSGTIDGNALNLKFAVIGGILWVKGAFTLIERAMSSSPPDYITEAIVTLKDEFKIETIEKGSPMTTIATPINCWYGDGTQSGQQSRALIFSSGQCVNKTQASQVTQSLVLTNNVYLGSVVRILPSPLGCVVK